MKQTEQWIIDTDIIFKKLKRKKRFNLNMALLCILIACFLIFRDKRITLYEGFVLVGAGSFILTWIWMIYIEKIKEYLPMIIIPLGALLTTIGIVYFYPDDTALTKADILGFTGSFLSFCGAFSLGYFIFVFGQRKNREESLLKIKKLYSMLSKIELELLKAKDILDYYIEGDDRTYLLIPIPIDADWRENYLEFELLNGENAELRRTLEMYFDYVQMFNHLIKQNKYVEAERYYSHYYEQQKYSHQKYNIFDAIECLLNGTYNGVSDTESWREKKENVELINELCEKFFPLIENYIYVWLLKRERVIDENGKKDTADIQREITKWLLNKSPDLRKLSNNPNLTRIVSYVVFLCCCRFSKKSTKVDYVWNEYSLK